MPYADRNRRLRASRESHARNPHIKKAWVKRNPAKRAAQIAVGNAIRDGRLVKGPCERADADCTGRVQAHHDDYAKPLEVRWLCTFHHAQLHNEMDQMSTTAPTATPAGVIIPSPDLVEKYGQIYKRGGFLSEWNVGRDNIIALMGIAKGATLDTFMVGDPGTGKTWLIELDLLTIPGAKLYDQLLMKDMSADDILGFRSINALKQDRLERVTVGFLPEANVGYLDEWDKGNATTQNGLLDITSKRMLKVGGKMIDCSQLLVIYFSGNAMPDREDLSAITDRLAIKFHVERIKTAEQRKRVMKIQLRHQREGIDLNAVPKITLDEWDQIKAEANAVTMPDAVTDRLVDALVKFDEAGFPPTERKVGQTMKAMKMVAWADGRSEVRADDMWVAAHMWWAAPDQAKKADDIIMEEIGGFVREAKYAREAMEPIVAKLNAAQRAVRDAGSDPEAQDDALGPVYELMAELRRLRSSTDQTIQRGKDEGHDVSLLEEVREKIEDADKWATDVFRGV